MERFKLYKVGDTTFVCKDSEMGIVCTFERHQFNETQNFKIEGKMSDVRLVARATREMSDWLAYNFYNIVMPLNHRARIGAEIKAMRVSLGLSQAELGEMCGLHQSHLARLETGRYSSSIDTLQSVAEAMGRQLSFCPLAEDDGGEIGLETPLRHSGIES